MEWSVFVIIDNDIFIKGKAIQEFISSVQFTGLVEHIPINMQVAKSVYVDLWQSDSQLNNFHNKLVKLGAKLKHNNYLSAIFSEKHILQIGQFSLFHVHLRARKMAIAMDVLLEHVEVTIAATHGNTLIQCRQKWGKESKCQTNFSLHRMKCICYNR